MTVEEFISNNYSYSKEPLAWRLFKGSVASLMNDYANYRLAFEKEQETPDNGSFSPVHEVIENRIKHFESIHHTYEATELRHALSLIRRLVPPIMFKIGCVNHQTNQSQPTDDPYWIDPATWPEWANWRAVGEDGCVYFSSILMEANTLYGSWSTSIYAASKMVPRAVIHNPDWRNSLRSREEVSRGK